MRTLAVAVAVLATTGAAAAADPPRATTVALLDPHVRQLGEQMDVVAVGAWRVRGRWIGTFVEIRVHGTLSGRFAWPRAHVTGARYRDGVHTCRLRAVRGLRGLVDMRRRKLVDLRPHTRGACTPGG